MKFNSFKLILAFLFSAFLLSGCETVSTDNEVDTSGSQQDVSSESGNDGEATDAPSTETSGAPEEPQISAQELAEQQARETQMKEQAALREMRTFYFDFDQFTVKSESRPALAAHAAFLSSNPSSKIVIEGHCDERGTKGYNIALGERRAQAVERFFVVNGVSKSQIEVISYGEERPAVSAHNDSAWAQNRRAYIEYQ